ncbi:MAG: PIN domain-containing protein [Clostridia bacterium]|nr:PIN domain-containing protein [Clostridia bacterium]MDH7574071.1 PIN domain-containing protein [Clostridia bacterium]
MILLDTNILVYAVNRDAPRHGLCRALIAAARRKELEAAVVPQVLLEFFAVVTDRRRVRRPLDPITAWQEVEVLRAGLRVVDPGPAALDRLAALLTQGKVAGAEVFDAWLAAQALAAGISTICTCNAADFAGIPGLVVREPEELAIDPGAD